jgi:hypothetical protein
MLVQPASAGLAYQTPVSTGGPNDDRRHSSDSRRIGTIPEDLVVGKAWLRVWPFNQFGLIEHYQLEPGATPADN